MKRCRQSAAILALFVQLLFANDARTADLFKERVQGFTQKYCAECHNEKTMRGELDLTRYVRASDVTGNFRRWNHIVEFIRDGQMPPEAARRQPSIDERNVVVAALEELLLTEARKHAGDPGVVLPRRLSNTEYDLSIRDLTGVDIRPTKEFPADPAAGEGFDNTGEALSMSPSLLKKYLSAAQHVSNHLVLKTDGITFAQFPVTSYNERKKLTEQAIIDFYQSHQVRVLDYLEAAWRYRHRGKAHRGVDVRAWAQRHGLSKTYLAMVWDTLNDASSGFGYLKTVGEMWDSIPAPSEGANVPQELVALDRFIEFCRGKLCHREDRLIRSNAGNWPISHLDFRAKTAKLRDQFDPGNFKSEYLIRFDRLRAPKNESQDSVVLRIHVDPAFGAEDSFVLFRRSMFSKNGDFPRNQKDEEKHEVVSLRSVLENHAPEAAKRLSFGKDPLGNTIDDETFAVKAPARIEIPLTHELLRQLDGKHLLVQCELDTEHSKEGCVHLQHATGKLPEEKPNSNSELLIHRDGELAKKLAMSAERFCRTFPNRFFYVDSKRGLAAGFHLVEGFFRDDQPLVEKVLNEEQRQELDQLWEELDFVTESAETLIRGFVWFERSERHVLHDKRFDFLRPEDPRLVENELLDRFEKVYMDRMGIKLVDDSLKPEQPSDKYDMIHGFFQQIRKGLAHRRELLKRAEQQAMSDLEDLARRAYRRPLRAEEFASLRLLYDKLRKQGQGVEESLRGMFTAILMSPDFCYHFSESPSGSDVAPMSDDALASRLSYFLWSSMPDDELLATAQQHKLRDEATLLAQTRRMLKDPKIEVFAREFFGQWLRYRDYLSKDSIVADSFPGYTDELRQAMFDEPTHLATYLIQQDKPVTDLLNSDTTFVNEVLAKHYGGDIARQFDTKGQLWQQVNGLGEIGRGGLFGMGVILTKNSAGERTSPVKRGFWTVHHLLGQHFPPPPADVPELPPNEREAKKTIRELITEHMANPKCAMCHKHFDSLGMALEGFDPIGRSRTKDLAGRAIDNVARLPNGSDAEGIPGLIQYIQQHRQDDFIRTLCRKFLGYALGRSLMLSDKPLLSEMEIELKKNDFRFSVLFETVVKSPQFRKQRGSEFVVTAN